MIGWIFYGIFWIAILIYFRMLYKAAKINNKNSKIWKENIQAVSAACKTAYDLLDKNKNLYYKDPVKFNTLCHYVLEMYNVLEPPYVGGNVNARSIFNPVPLKLLTMEDLDPYRITQEKIDLIFADNN